MKVLVIGGGISDEREVALRSSKSTFDAAKAAGFDVDFYDWDGDKEWLIENGRSYDVALPILHGYGGEDGQIQSILDKIGIRYLGSDSIVSKKCYDKQLTKNLLLENGILMPKGQMVDRIGYDESELSNSRHVLKPVDGGSSIDMLIDVVRNDTNPARLDELFAKHSEMLIEEYIDGIEITIPVLDGKDLPVIEIIPPTGETFDYQNKYNGKTNEVCPPKNVDVTTQDRAVDLAHKVHQIMGCRHFSRVDIIVRSNELYVLEINTIPGLTPTSLFPLSAKTAGIEMPQLVAYLLQLVQK